jgi:hypothetical protein
MHEPFGISLGSATVCSIVYVPLSTGHWIETFAFALSGSQRHGRTIRIVTHASWQMSNVFERSLMIPIFTTTSTEAPS